MDWIEAITHTERHRKYSPAKLDSIMWQRACRMLVTEPRSSMAIISSEIAS